MIRSLLNWHGRNFLQLRPHQGKSWKAAMSGSSRYVSRFPKQPPTRPYSCLNSLAALSSRGPGFAFYSSTGHSRQEHLRQNGNLKDVNENAVSSNLSFSSRQTKPTSPASGVSMVHAIHTGRRLDHVIPSQIVDNLNDDESTTVTSFRTEHNAHVIQVSSSSPQVMDWKFVVIFPFGCVVFFNFSSEERDTLKEQLLASTARARKNKVITPAASPSSSAPRRETFQVVIDPTLATSSNETSSVVTGEMCRLPELDEQAVVVVASIMAQTVSLDYYNDRVKELLEEFSQIHRAVTQVGGRFIPSAPKKQLFKSIAENNAILLEMVQNLRIQDRFSWELAPHQLEFVYEGLQHEFDIEKRFQNLEFKIDLMQKNAKFFLEILHHQKSNTLEWIIIILIVLECILMVLEMSGHGQVLMERLGNAYNRLQAKLLGGSLPPPPPSSASASD